MAAEKPSVGSPEKALSLGRESVFNAEAARGERRVLFMAKGLDGVHAGGANRWKNAGGNGDGNRTKDDPDNHERMNDRRDLSKVINGRIKDFAAGDVLDDHGYFIDVAYKQQAIIAPVTETTMPRSKP